MIIDWELILMIIVALLLVICIRFMFTLLARHRILKIIAIIFLSISILSIVAGYVIKNEDVFQTDRRYYIYGRVKIASIINRQVEIDSVNTSLLEGGKGRILIKIPDNIKIYLEKNGKNEEIDIREIRYGDTIQVYCKESKISEVKKEITATKIIKKFGTL